MKGRIGVAAAIACALVVALAGCGDSSGPSQEELKEAEHAGAERAQQHEKIHQIEKQLGELRHGGSKQGSPGEKPAPESSSAPAPEGTTSSSGNCGGGLSANQYTTCGFGENVEDAYYAEIGSGSGTVEAWSPTTEQTYSMYCTSGAPHECTGGNNAAVFFP
jgi:hypothetical protein